MQYGLQQPCDVVRNLFARYVCYLVLAGLAVLAGPGSAQQSGDTLPVDFWSTGWFDFQVIEPTAAAAAQTTCNAWYDKFPQAYNLRETLWIAPGYSAFGCHGRYVDADYNTKHLYSAYFSLYPTCANGYNLQTSAGDIRSNALCVRAACLQNSEVCQLTANTSSVVLAAAVCKNTCLLTQSLGACTERFIGGQQLFFCQVTKQTTGAHCSSTGGVEAACSSISPPAQDPCQLPGAATNPACGGGAGCPTGYTVLANGACTPNDSSAPCVPPSYRVGGVGACVPYAGPGAGTGGGGTGAAGAGGTGGNSGSTGGAGGNGGAGSANGGGGGGGSGGQGGGGGAGGSAGAGGQGGQGGAGGAAKEDVKCGATGALCQTKFEEYFQYVKDLFGVTGSDATAAASGRAEIAKSDAGGYADNGLNRGPVRDMSSLSTGLSFGTFLPKTCPAARSFSVGAGSFTISLLELCSLAQIIGAVLVAGTALSSAMYVFRGA